MTLEQLLLSPVLPFALLSATAIAVLYLFLTLKAEIAGLRRQCQRQAAALQCATQRTETKHAELERDYERFLRMARLSDVGSRALGSFSRAKIQGLHLQGEQTPMIAERLGIPDAQVDLTLKVRRMTGAVASEC